jgi:hypothetical protein
MNTYIIQDGELYHHGVKGMKWGVRKYQNYDGSYTKAGMKRFNESLDKYEKADQHYKNTKAAYKAAKKSGVNTDSAKAEFKNAKLDRKTTKKKLEKDYKHLKQDKLADQGKELYAKGKTITGNAHVTGILSTIGSVSLGIAINNSQAGVGNQTVNKVLAIGGLGAMAAGVIKGVVDYSQNKKLRAYYTHTSKY